MNTGTIWEGQRADIISMVGPGRFTLWVWKDLRDAVLTMYKLTPEEVPGLIELCPPGELGTLDGITIRTIDTQAMYVPSPPRRPDQKPLPYPPRLRGRYGR